MIKAIYQLTIDVVCARKGTRVSEWDQCLCEGFTLDGAPLLAQQDNRQCRMIRNNSSDAVSMAFVTVLLKPTRAVARAICAAQRLPLHRPVEVE